MTTATEADVYVTALAIDEIFADPTYQRDLDEARARKMAAEWDRRLAGILEVSDRGEGHSPRFAVMDGMHRWAAAGKLETPPSLVANVHSGLTVADEAVLFDKFNRLRKQTNTWDHWKARRVAGDEQVVAIEACVERNGLVTDMSAQDGRIACVATLEKVVKLGGIDLLNSTLALIVEVWDVQRAALDASLIYGVGLVLWYLDGPIDLGRLADALLGVSPRQIKASASTLAELTSGSLSVRTAIAVMSLYNKTPGRRLLVSNRTFTGQRKVS